MGYGAIGRYEYWILEYCDIGVLGYWGITVLGYRVLRVLSILGMGCFGRFVREGQIRSNKVK